MPELPSPDSKHPARRSAWRSMDAVARGDKQAWLDNFADDAIVEEARSAGLEVAAHASTDEAIRRAIRAGARTIEHGTYLDEEVADAMFEIGAILVPTRFVVDFLMSEGEKRGMPAYAKKKGQAASESHSDAVALAHQRGVKIALGTDIWMTGLWGRNGEELPLLIDCGLTPLEAIETATANGPATLGPQAPNAGQLVKGMDADVICVSGDPSSDVSILASPDNITQVFKGGTRYKG